MELTDKERNFLLGLLAMVAISIVGKKPALYADLNVIRAKLLMSANDRDAVSLDNADMVAAELRGMME